MQLYRNGPVSIDEYFRIREKSDELLEYIDGIIYMSPSPSTKHQRISGKLFLELSNHLSGNPCELFSAPYDIELTNDQMDNRKVVIPDISVLCDKSGFTETKYIGVPNLIVEILSPSNQSHDLITKLNLYMNYGVEEYWIVNPMLNTITVYALNKEKMYEQHDVKSDFGLITSKLFESLQVDLKQLFAD